MEFGVFFWVSLLALVSLGHGQGEDVIAPAAPAPAEPVITEEGVLTGDDPGDLVLTGVPEPMYPPIDPSMYPPTEPPKYPPMYPPIDSYPPETGYISSTGDAYPPPSDYLPPNDYPPQDEYDTAVEYIPPDVIYPPSYSEGDPFAVLWQQVWSQAHFMKYKVDSVEAYRDKMMLKINKLSHKVFAWCRCEKNYHYASNYNMLHMFDRFIIANQ